MEYFCVWRYVTYSGFIEDTICGWVVYMYEMLVGICLDRCKWRGIRGFRGGSLRLVDGVYRGTLFENS